jgi:hypothetical protein
MQRLAGPGIALVLLIAVGWLGQEVSGKYRD